MSAEATTLIKAAESAVGIPRDVLLRSAHSLILRSSITACTACPLHSTVNAPVPWEGGPSNVAIIGEAPGANEDRKGRPFVGQAGRLLDSVLGAVGLPRNQITLINTICCRPPSNDYARAIDVGANFKCRPWFSAQIEFSSAWILVPVGNYALHALLPDTGPISSVRGKLMWRDRHLIAPTFHPAYALRTPTARASLEYDLSKVVSILKGESVAPVPKSYDPTKLVSSLRHSTTSTPSLARTFKSKGWVMAYSDWLEDHIICVRDRSVRLPPALEGVVYTVAELVQLSHFDRSWETARRIHYTKKAFGATIV